MPAVASTDSAKPGEAPATGRPAAGDRTPLRGRGRRGSRPRLPSERSATVPIAAARTTLGSGRASSTKPATPTTPRAVRVRPRAPRPRATTSRNPTTSVRLVPDTAARWVSPQVRKSRPPPGTSAGRRRPRARAPGHEPRGRRGPPPGCRPAPPPRRRGAQAAAAGRPGPANTGQDAGDGDVVRGLQPARRPRPADPSRSAAQAGSPTTSTGDPRRGRVSAPGHDRHGRAGRPRSRRTCLSAGHGSEPTLPSSSTTARSSARPATGPVAIGLRPQPPPRRPRQRRPARSRRRAGADDPRAPRGASRAATDPTTAASTAARRAATTPVGASTATRPPAQAAPPSATIRRRSGRSGRAGVTGSRTVRTPRGSPPRCRTTSSSSSTALNAPWSERHCRIAAAVTGPTPGSVSSSTEVAVLRLTRAASGWPPAPPLRAAPPR